MKTSTHTATVSAAAFAVLYGLAVQLPSLPQGGDDDPAVLSLLSDGSARTLIVLAGYLFTAAGLALLPFVAILSTRLRVGLPAASSLPTVVQSAGLLYVTMVLVAGTLFSGYATGIAVGELSAPEEPTLFRVLSNQGFAALLLPGLLAAAVLVLSASIGGARTGLLSPAVRRTGYVFAALLLLGFAWAPQFLVPIWVVVVGVALDRESSAVATGSVRVPETASN